MSFFETVAPKDACDICGTRENLTGQGIWDVVEERYTFYLCPECLEAEEKRIAAQKAATQKFWTEEEEDLRQ